MSPELQKAYEDAALPFTTGQIGEPHTRMNSWRYFLEINSVCNLRCPTCTKGNQKGYDHQTGLMDMDLMEKILDKIVTENPNATILTYGNSEPFLHPELAKCIASIKRRGFRCEVSTNLNKIPNIEDVLAAQPDLMIVSLSGFTQDVYVKGHTGGNIERVKENMGTLAVANIKTNPSVNIMVNYHVYDYNEHEVPMMKAYAEGLGFSFFTCLARAISMENSIQYCRSKDPESTPFEIQEGKPDWNQVLPPIGQTYIETMNHLQIPPTAAREMYKDVPIHPVCPVGAGSIFTFIRHDGKVQMCSCTADRRITIGDYLDMTPDQMIEKRTGHSICRQCIKYRLNLYFMIADREKWNP